MSNERLQAVTTHSSGEEAFIELSRQYLLDHYLPKAERCLERLTDEQIWWRPNEASNSIGNLVLHVCGSARQWIAAGVGGASDVRHRQQEFDERTLLPRAELLTLLRTTLDEIDSVLAEADVDRMLELRRVQGREVTAMEAIYHTVEHFSMHTGQILFITKMLVGEDLGFYETHGDKVVRRWQGRSGPIT